jgi:transposase
VRLQILNPLISNEIINTQYACADETSVQALEDKKVRTSKKAYMWIFTAGKINKALMVYQFVMTRAVVVAEEFFNGFAGFLQTDAFGGYNKLGKSEDITRV